MGYFIKRCFPKAFYLMSTKINNMTEWLELINFIEHLHMRVVELKENVHELQETAVKHLHTDIKAIGDIINAHVEHRKNS